jgi:hypothetical protein
VRRCSARLRPGPFLPVQHNPQATAKQLTVIYPADAIAIVDDDFRTRHRQV